MVDVTMIGTAGAVPLPERALSSCVITVDGRSILFDCGEGTQIAAKKAGVNLMRVDFIALTHYHGDHIFGLPGLLQSLNLAERQRPLYIIAPVKAGGRPIELENILTMAGTLNYDVTILKMHENGMSLPVIVPEWPLLSSLYSFRTEHRVVSSGYTFYLGRTGRFYPEKARELGIPVKLWKQLQYGFDATFTDESGIEKTVHPAEVTGPARKGIKISFTGDTRKCRSLEEGARDADLFICDATYGSDEYAETAKEYCHMTFPQAGKVAAKAGAKRLWLTHYSQRMNDPEQFLKNAQEEFPGAECAFDGKMLSLDFE